ncbi:MAG: tetratricopeptide repeat protein, partial [Myxococcales bacterium]|nr:tetratricopeptide repeat protein [Myxococcales bacterium]
RPGVALYLSNLGNALLALGDVAGAEAAYQQAVRADPKHGDAWNNLGALYLRRGDLDAADEALRVALRLRPGPLVHANLGDVRVEEGALDEAAHHYDVAARALPANRYKAAMLLTPIVDSEADIDAQRAHYAARLDALEQDPPPLSDPSVEVGSRAFYLAYHGRDDRALQARLARLMVRACPSLGWQAPHCASYRGPGPRIRVGVCSAYLHRHTIGKLYRGLIEHLDRRRFEVLVLRPPGPADDLSAAIDAAADGVVGLSAHLATARRQVADLALDVLFYPDIGMNPQTVYLAYARLAPVQCVSWGHPDTTGIPNLDVFVSGPGLEPPGAEAHYTERLVQLPRLPVCYAAPAPVTAPLTAADLGLPTDARLYACPQSLFKLHPRFDPVLRDLLAADPQAHVLLIEGPRPAWDERLRRRLALHLDPDALRRVVALPRMPTPRFQQLLAGADVVLDPPYFGGGNSTFEALAHGAPVVTWPGPFMRGRVTAACYAAIGVDDAVATDL